MTHTLAEQARVTILPETIAEAERELTPKERIQLRRQRIMDYIESKPAGTIIRRQEFFRVGQFKSQGHLNQFLKTMLKKGLITRYEETPRKHSYSVGGRTVKPKRTAQETVTSTPPPGTTSQAVHRLARAACHAIWVATSRAYRGVERICGLGERTKVRRQR